MADFADFHLERVDPMALADGLVPEMAGVFGVDIDTNDLVGSLGDLVGVMGRSKALKDNIGQVQEVLGTDQDGFGIAAHWLERSGIQRPLDRSLWTPEHFTPQDVGSVVLTDAVANQMDRMATTLVQRSSLIAPGTEVNVAVGNRVMDKDTERANPNIQKFYDEYGHYPTAEMYAWEIFRPTLEGAGYDVDITAYDTDKGIEVAQRFVADNQKTFDTTVMSLRVANSGIQNAGQLIRSARATGIDFDTNPDKPQAFVVTDSVPIAKTLEDANDSARFQDPRTAIRQIIVTARTLAQLAI